MTNLINKTSMLLLYMTDESSHNPDDWIAISESQYNELNSVLPIYRIIDGRTPRIMTKEEQEKAKRYQPKTMSEIFIELDSSFTEEQTQMLNDALIQYPLWIPMVQAGNYSEARNVAQYFFEKGSITKEVYDTIDRILPMNKT